MPVLKPIVRLIAKTAFIGVPLDLVPATDPAVIGDDVARALETQDVGTSAARLIECAGRVCYDSYGKGRGSAAYHKHILEVGHGSVMEHASFSFFLSNISRGCTHELVRHRVGVAISQRSTRYVDESVSAWVWHPLLAKLDDPALLREIDDAEGACRGVYDKVVERLQGILQQEGCDKLTARKQARGAARG